LKGKGDFFRRGGEIFLKGRGEFFGRGGEIFLEGERGKGAGVFFQGQAL
jgi:hypothetical protein